MNFIQSINFYIERLSEAFSINNIFMFVLLGLILIGITSRVIARIVKKEKIKNIYSYILLILPTIIYFMFVSEIAPDVEAKYAIRYILDFLKTDTELQSQEQFVLSVKKWMNVEDTLNKILEYTGFTKYELLLNREDDTQSMIYLITK